MTDRIRVGVVGANMSAADPLRHSWGVRAHLPALTQLPQFEVVAVCTNHADTARQTASHFGVPLVFDDARDLIRHPAVDVVDVCIAAAAHHGVVLDAVANGKHVVCEWPLGADVAQARELHEAATTRAVRHAICLQARYAPVYQHMRHLVASGYVGQVLSCSLNGSMAMAPSPRSASLGLIHFGHCIDTLCFVAGQEVATESSVVELGAVSNHVLVHGRLSGGALFDLGIRHIPAFATGLTLEVDGTEGVLVAAIDGTDLAARGVRSLGEQLNQVSLKGARRGTPVAEIVVPNDRRWVAAGVGSGPPLAIAQLLHRFGESLRSGSTFASDFGLARQRHELYADLLAR